MKKKLLLDLERLRYPNSGIANVFRNLAIGLMELSDESNSNISFFAAKNTLLDIDSKYPVLLRKDIHKFFSFYSKSYDILHTSHQLSSFFHSKRKGQKKIVTLHDLNFLHEDLSSKKRKKMLKKVKNNIENADVIVCISDFSKQDLLANKSLFHFKIMPEIEVIHNGMQFPELKTYPLDAYEYLKDKKYILNIGVLFPKKNQLLLVQLLPFIKEDLVLVVSGNKEPYKTEVLSEIKTLGLENRVHILSNISENEKWALIQNCESMCHPSIAEGFGIPPIEAMYFGKPVFLSDKTSLPEIGGKVANYFDSLESAAILEVYQNGMEEYHQNIEQKSKELNNWAKKYSYLEMAKNYLELYNRCI